MPRTRFYYPVVGVALVLVELAHALLGEFGVFDLLHALVSDLREPTLEGFGFGAGDGLDDAEGGFGTNGLGFPTNGGRGGKTN
jgi:hypothetical protein